MQTVEKLNNGETLGVIRGKLNKNFLGIAARTVAIPAQINYIGDSQTYGIGTTGGNSYPNQSFARLDNSANIFTSQVFGYPGQNALNFMSNEVSIVDAALSTDKLNVMAIDFGANDLTGSGTSVRTIFQNVVNVHLYYRAKGAKTIAIPVPNRKDIYSDAGYNARRMEFYYLMKANWRFFADAFVDLANQPLLFDEAAPDNPIYFAMNDVNGLSKVHWTNAGAALIAEEVAREIAYVTNTTLTYSAVQSHASDEILFAAIDRYFKSRTGWADDDTINFTGKLEFSAPSVPAIPTALSVASSTGVSQSGTVYLPTTPNNSAWGKTILFTKKLAAGKNGYIQMTLNNVDDIEGMLGFKTTGAEGGYSGFAYAFWTQTPNQAVYVLTNGAPQPAIPNVYQDMKVRLSRTNGVVSLIKSTDDFVTQTTLYTWPGTYNGELYPVADMQGTGRINTPIGYNLQ